MENQTEGKAPVFEDFAELPPVTGLGTVETVTDETGETETKTDSYAVEAQVETGENVTKSDTSEIFDPNIHAVDRSGNPVYTESGKLRRKSGRKSATNPATDETRLNSVKHTAKPAEPQAQKPVLSDKLRIAAADKTAEYMTGLVFMLGQSIDVEEFAPVVNEKTGENEPAMLKGAFSAYLMTRENPDLPPVAGLVLALGLYFGKRATAPRTGGKIKEFFRKLFKRGE